MDLTAFPRRCYTGSPTPLQPLRRLSAELGGPQIWIKRDDLLGLALGGNKTRKLEFLVADALTRGADALVTAGGVQSNHCRLTLAASRVEGLECHLVLEEDLGPDGTAIPAADGGNPPESTGNRLLFDVLGAETVEVHPHGADLAARMQALAADLEARGRHPYVIPIGGSNALGALGYVDGAREMLAQFEAEGLAVDEILVPSGSAGMQAGLLAGLHAAGSAIDVVGINVSRPRETQEPKIRALLDEVTDLLGLPAVAEDRVVGLGEQVGPGYALPTPEMVEAVRMFARTEGVILDPVYTGKAAAGLLDRIRRGLIGPEQTVVLLHSGGAPGLFARASAFA
jgi:D-cysteine desulfhydrase